MKKSTKILLLAVVGVALGVYGLGLWQVSRINADIVFADVGSNLLMQFPMDSTATFRAQTGGNVYFDMGSRHSFCTPEEVERLRARNYPIEERRCLLLTTDKNGHYRLYTRKIKLDVPIPNADLAGGYYYIRNAELIVDETVDDNVFGMDFLRHLALERVWDSNELRLYRHAPQGYVAVCDINVYGPGPGSTMRASINLKVNDEEPREYFFDTGGDMRAVELVQPLHQADYALSAVKVDSVTGLKVQRRCKVQFGNRLRYSSVVYCDTLHTDEYSVNPLRLFDQDMVLDMKGKKLMIHKTRN